MLGEREGDPSAPGPDKLHDVTYGENSLTMSSARGITYQFANILQTYWRGNDRRALESLFSSGCWCLFYSGIAGRAPGYIQPEYDPLHLSSECAVVAIHNSGGTIVTLS